MLKLTKDSRKVYVCPPRRGLQQKRKKGTFKILKNRVFKFRAVPHTQSIGGDYHSK